VAGPSWLADILAAVMLATAAYCVSRLIISRTSHRATHQDVDLAHGVMGVAMAGMLVTRLNPLPAAVWVVVFGTASAWFAGQVSRVYRSRRAGARARAGGHYVPHLVMCGAMVYMLLAVTAVKPGSSDGGISMGGSAGAARFPLLALVLALYMVGYVMWEADRLPARARVGAVLASHGGPAGAPGPADVSGAALARLSSGLLSPRLAACCQIAMGITMGYTLILML